MLVYAVLIYVEQDQNTRLKLYACMNSGTAPKCKNRYIQFEINVSDQRLRDY